MKRLRNADFGLRNVDCGLRSTACQQSPGDEIMDFEFEISIPQSEIHNPKFAIIGG